MSRITVDTFVTDLPIDFTVSLALRALNTTDEGEYLYVREAALTTLEFLLSIVASSSVEASYLETYIERIHEHHPKFSSSASALPKAIHYPTARQNALHIPDILYCILSHIDPEDGKALQTYLACSRAWGAFREPAQAALWRNPPPLDSVNQQIAFIFAHLVSLTGRRTTRGLGRHVQKLYLVPIADFAIASKILSFMPNLCSLTLDFSQLPDTKLEATELNAVLYSRLETLRDLTFKHRRPFQILGDLGSPSYNLPLPPRFRLTDLSYWFDFPACRMSENVRDFGISTGKGVQGPLVTDEFVHNISRFVVGNHITTLTLTGGFVTDSGLLAISYFFPRLEALEITFSRNHPTGVPTAGGIYKILASMEYLRILFIWAYYMHPKDDDPCILAEAKSSLEAFGCSGLGLKTGQLRTIAKAHRSSLKWLYLDQWSGVEPETDLLETLADCPRLLYVGCEGLEWYLGRRKWKPAPELVERLRRIGGVRWAGKEESTVTSRRRLERSQMFEKLVAEPDWSTYI